MNRLFVLFGVLLLGPVFLLAEDAEPDMKEGPAVAYTDGETDVYVTANGTHVYKIDDMYYPYYTHYQTKHVGYRGAHMMRAPNDGYREMHQTRHGWRQFEDQQRLHQGMYGRGRGG